MNLDNMRPLTSEGVRPAVTASPRLQTAAHQFEASLLNELLKPMREHSEFSGNGDEDDGDSSSEGSMREYGTEAMAQALSERGGVGIAKLVLQKLAPVEAARGEKAKAAPVKAELRGNRPEKR